MEPKVIDHDSYRQFIELYHLDIDSDQLKGKVNEIANNLFLQFRERKNLSYDVNHSPPFCTYEVEEIIGGGKGWNQLLQASLSHFGIVMDLQPLEAIKASNQKHIFGMEFPQGYRFKLILKSELSNPNIFGNFPEMLKTQFSSPSLMPQSKTSNPQYPSGTEEKINPSLIALNKIDKEFSNYQRALYNYLRDHAKDSIRDQLRIENLRQSIITKLDQQVDAFVENILTEFHHSPTRRLEKKIYANGVDELKKILDYKFNLKNFFINLHTHGGEVIDKNVHHIFGTELFDHTFEFIISL